MRTNIVKFLILTPFILMPPSFAQQGQYNPPSFYSPGGGASTVVVPPTVIMAGDQNSSKKSCRENVIDLFLFSWRTRTGDCTD